MGGWHGVSQGWGCCRLWCQSSWGSGGAHADLCAGGREAPGPGRAVRPSEHRIRGDLALTKRHVTCPAASATFVFAINDQSKQPRLRRCFPSLVTYWKAVCALHRQRPPVPVGLREVSFLQRSSCGSGGRMALAGGWARLGGVGCAVQEGRPGLRRADPQ